MLVILIKKAIFESVLTPVKQRSILAIDSPPSHNISMCRIVSWVNTILYRSIRDHNVFS